MFALLALLFADMKTLQLNVITAENKVEDPEKLMEDLIALKSANVDGVMVDCWWGIVESETPQKYDWTGYKQLFSMVKEAKLKLQVISISRNACKI